MLALLALTVDESDEAFANVYSGAVSLQNLLPRRAAARCSSRGAAAVATVGALLVDLRNYQPFLYLLGSFFVPLFGVLLADWLLAGRHYSRDDVFPAPDLRLEMIGAWLAGFGLYQWLYPQGPGLVDAARRAQPIRTRCPGAARRCRASRWRSCSPRSPASSRGGPYCRARDRAARKPLA